MLFNNIIKEITRVVEKICMFNESTRSSFFLKPPTKIITSFVKKSLLCFSKKHFSQRGFLPRSPLEKKVFFYLRRPSLEIDISFYAVVESREREIERERERETVSTSVFSRLPIFRGNVTRYPCAAEHGKSDVSSFLACA